MASKTISTQCNLTLIDKTVLKRNKQVQTIKDRETKITKLKSKVSKHFGCQFKSPGPKLKHISLQIIPSTKSSSNQTILNKVKPEKTIKTFNAQTQCHFGVNLKERTKEFSTQTDTESKSVNFIEHSESFLLQFCIRESKDRNLTTTMFRNNRGEDSLLLFNPRFVGLFGIDLPVATAMITESGKCTLAVLFRRVEEYNLVLDSQVLEEEAIKFIKTVNGLGYKFCPGISDVVGSPSLSDTTVYSTLYPCRRLMSVNCSVWYQNDTNNTGGVAQCFECRKSSAKICKAKKRRNDETFTCLNKRLKIDSKYPLARLSPESVKSRVNALKESRKQLRKKVKKLEEQLAHRSILLSESDTDSELTKTKNKVKL